MRRITLEIIDRDTTPGRNANGLAYMQGIPVTEDGKATRVTVRDADTGAELGELRLSVDHNDVLVAGIGGWDERGDWIAESGASDLDDRNHNQGWFPLVDERH